MKKKIAIYSLVFTLALSGITSIPKKAKAYDVKKYSNGYVYIIKPNEKLKINDSDVLIVDERKKNSNISVVNSYKITNINKMLEIIDIILEYDKNNPINNYNRSKDSLSLEWITHNFLYYLFIERDRTTDVDFENNEEDMYNIKTYIKKFLGK